MTRYPHYLLPQRGDSYPQYVLCVDCVSAAGAGRDRTGRAVDRLVSWHAQCLRLVAGEYQLQTIRAGETQRSWWTLLYEWLTRRGHTWILSYQCPRVWSLLGLWEELENERLSITAGGPPIGRKALGEVAVHRQGGTPPDEAPRQPKTEEVADATQQQGAQTERRLRYRSDTLPLLPHDGTHSQHAQAPKVRLSGPIQRTGVLVIDEPPCIARLYPTVGRGELTWVDARNYGLSPPEGTAEGVRSADWCANVVRCLLCSGSAYSLGSLQTTSAAQATRGWRTSYLSHGVYCHNDRPILQLEGASYYGGRCEAYRIGAARSTVWHMDIRSCYAAICVGAPLPSRLQGYDPSPSRARAERLANTTAAIATVTLTTAEPAYPLHRGGITIWPTGRYRTTLCGPELRDALDRDCIEEWHEIAWYHSDPALSDYMEALLRMRACSEAAGDVLGVRYAKALYTSVVGKLGQRSKVWTYIPEVWSDVPYGEWYGRDRGGLPCRYRAVAWNVERESSGDWGADSIPAMAAWITSLARMRLLCLIRVAGWGHVLYVDTDTIMADAVGYDALHRAGAISLGTAGALELRGQYTTTVVRGIKDYTADGVRTCAGLPRGVSSVQSDDHTYLHSSTPITDVRRGLRPATTVRMARYERHQPYRHGVVAADGTVTPIVLGGENGP